MSFMNRNDVAGMFVNVDRLIDIYSEAQKVNGVKPTFEESVGKDPVKKETSKHSNEIHKEKCSHCDKCENPVEDKPIGKRKLPEFNLGWDDDNDEFDDDAEEYVCEYCQEIGYSQKYKPDLCDSCRKCEDCKMYEDGDCIGCDFSVYPDGLYYREKLSEIDLFSEKDLSTFKELSEDDDVRVSRNGVRFHLG